MQMTAATTVTVYGQPVTAYVGPTSWQDVPHGIYFNFAELTAILGDRIAPELEATDPSGTKIKICSGWTVAETLSRYKDRRSDLREAILATRQADEAFGNAPKGYNWQAI